MYEGVDGNRLKFLNTLAGSTFPTFMKWESTVECAIALLMSKAV